MGSSHNYKVKYKVKTDFNLLECYRESNTPQRVGGILPLFLRLVFNSKNYRCVSLAGGDSAYHKH